MILGVDHLALSCRRLDAAVAALARTGYSPQFQEPSLPNHRAKSPFLRRIDPLHGIAYCRGPMGIAIELTAHHEDHSGEPGCYQTLWTKPPADAVVVPGKLPEPLATVFSDLHLPSMQTWTWADFSTQLFAGEKMEHNAGIQTVLLGVLEMAESLNFWVEGLGARVIRQTTSSALLAFDSPLASLRAEVLLYHDARRPGPNHLDAPGFTCLALVSTSVAQDAGRGAAHGARQCSDTFELCVAEKPLVLSLLEGPNGELVELIEFARR